MKRIIGTVAFCLGAAALPACGTAERPTQARASAPVSVTLAPARLIDTVERLEAGGLVAARESAAISSRIVATIAAVRVTAGNRVLAGDVLVTLDARDVTERTGQTRASAGAAESALIRARTEHSTAAAEHRLAAAWQKRIAALHARNSATDQERDEADFRLAAAAARLAGTQAGIEGADASLASARAALRGAVATESFANLRAPFDGLITERLTDPGNLAAPGLPLLRLESDGARQVVVRVDEARAAYVHIGDRVRVAIDVPDEQPARDAELDGVVSEIARAIGADQRSFMVKVSTPAAVTARTGSFARVIFRGAPRRALVVPEGAVQRHGQVSSVYVVHDNVARLRLVQLGAPFAEGVEVLAGLDAGESVVISPPPRLSDGAAVAAGAVPARTGGRR